MTEILIVIALVVLLLGLAVPAFNLIRGSRSVDGAENQVAAMLAKARVDAIGLQKPHGILFFIEPRSERVHIAEVYAADFPETGVPNRAVYLDLVADVDFLPLPPGVLAFVFADARVGGGLRTSDGYIGFNNNFSSATANGHYAGGLILFNGDGQLISRTYGYRTMLNGNPTAIANLLALPTTADFAEAGLLTFPSPPGPPVSAIGFALCDEETFKNKGSLADAIFTGQAYATSELDEEKWLDDNSSQLLINRYNGTLTRAD